ncbi:hypothetical protein HG531_003770 [Fusarium graminearum]|nr:hypothetical protein HG531_003770 [Fusarium graminearum]
MAPRFSRVHLAVLQLPAGDAVVEGRSHEVNLDKLGLVVDLVCGPGLVLLLEILVEGGLAARRVDLLVGLAQDGVFGDVLPHDVWLFGGEGSPEEG